MRHKILIADDSLTIQKVIKITLASEPFDLEVCSTAKDLSGLVQSYNPNIVLLDFNLSEDQTGYDLCQKIKSINANIKVFMLFGTFDTIDDDKLSESGCDNKIVKPFDGTKFINICRTLADSISINDGGDEDSTFDYDSSIEEESSDEDEMSEEENWVMDAPEHEDAAPVEMKAPPKAEKSVLAKEMEDWGMDVPGIIGQDSDIPEMEIPEVIDMSQPAVEDDFPDVIEDEQPVEELDDISLPNAADLEYPDFGASSDDFEIENNDRPRPQLVPISELNLDNAPTDDDMPAASSGFDEIDFDAPPEGTNTPEELARIQAQIADEIEADKHVESEPAAQGDDLWSFDVVEEKTEADISAEDKALEEALEEPKIVSPSFDEFDDLPAVSPHKLEEVTDEFADDSAHHIKDDYDPDFIKRALDDFPDEIEVEKPKPEVQQAVAKDIMTDAEFEAKIKEQLKPIVEEYVRQYSKTMIEKVAWEVIPDLAENLIKKEIEKISDSIINS